jgi:putative hydrolase of the HAD superfamily
LTQRSTPIDAVIFDLDNCLADATEVGPALVEPMFAAIRAANDGRLTEAALERAFADSWRMALDVVAEKHGFSPAMLDAGWAVARTLAVTTPMRGYADLPVLRDLGVPLFLVTSGFRRLQESKIDALGLRGVLTAFVDAIDEPDRLGKRGLFSQIAAAHGFTPARVLIVGDNLESEIAAGNALGMPTVQLLRPGVVRADGARSYAADLHDIRRLVEAGSVTSRQGRSTASRSSTARPRGDRR